MRRFVHALAIAALVALFSLGVYLDLSVQRFTPEQKVDLASTLNIPFTFSSGQVIFASQMNANFQAIRAVINALDDQNIANASITGSLKLIDGTVPLAKLGTDSVNSSKVVDSSLTTADLLDGTILAEDLADGAVTGLKILDGTIAPNDIANDAVTEPKIDFASAPTTGFDVFWNGTKLDYRTRVTSATTCTQVLTSMGTHQYGGGTTNNFSSWVDLTTPTGTTADTTPIPFRNPKSITFCNLAVFMAATPPISTTFSLRATGGVPINPSCSVASGGPTTCTDVVNCTGSGALAVGWVLQTSAAGTSPVQRAYSAYLCTSPF